MGMSIPRRLERLAHLERLVIERGWIRPAEGVVCAPGQESLLRYPCGLVFDIDGVLIDTHRSFREVIPQSVNFYLEVILQEDGRAPLMRAEDVHAWKMAGGFNNDWDVAEAGLLYSLWWSRWPESAPSLLDLSQQLARRGGGLGALRETLMERASPDLEQLAHDVDRGTLERIFKELYIGGARFREVFGEEPRFYRGIGGMTRERPLVGGSSWVIARGWPIGIFTGRVPPEARLALQRTGLADRLPLERVVTDDGRFPPKPDPGGLLHLARQIPDRPLFYFGDNRDDLTALLEARHTSGDKDLHFIYCLSGSTDRDAVDWFVDRGTRLVAVEVPDALEVMQR
jgi:HAD superfamily phosphatase